MMDTYLEKRVRMAQEQIVARGIKDIHVLKAMRSVARHLFVPLDLESRAYDDGALPIGHQQTISQPYIVAFMTEVLQLSPSDKVLEIGTGSGYQTAILAEIVKEVYSIERLEPLASQAKERLTKLGYKNIKLGCLNGYAGWPQYAPFDKIIVTAAPEDFPLTLAEQLKVGGKMVIPMGEGDVQELYLVERNLEGWKEIPLMDVRFVPLVKDK